MKFIILLLIPFSVIAGGNTTTTNNYYITEVTDTTGTTGTASTTSITNSSINSKGVASAIATGQCQFDHSYALQGCAAVGTYDGGNAFAVGLAQKSGDMLFNGTVVVEEGGQWAGGAAVNIKFK